MIIQCEQCRTKFRLDDAKIKEQGVKVRCSKCKHVFLVSREAAAEEPDFDAFLSGLGSASVAPTETSAPPAAEPGRLSEPAVAEQPRHDEPVSPTPGVAAETVPPAGEAISLAGIDDFTPGPEPAAGIAPAPPDVGAEGEGDRQEFEFFAPGVTSEEPVPGEPASFSGTETWREWGVSSLAADQQDAAAPMEGREEPGGGLEFGEIAVARDDWGGAEPFTEALSAPTAPFSPEEGVSTAGLGPVPEEAPVSSQEFSFDLPPDVHEAAAPRPIPAEMEPLDFGPLVAEAAPPEPQVTPSRAAVPEEKDVPTLASPVPPLVPATGAGTEGEELPPLPIASRRRGSSFLTVALSAMVLLVVVAALGIGTYVYREGPAALARLGLGFVGKWMDLEPAEEGTISVRNGVGTYVESTQAGLLLMVTGEAVNQFKKPRASIQVKVTLFNAQGQAVASKSAFCGNMLSREQVATLPFAKIEAAMNNQFGDSLANLGVLPGKAIPFLVVFPSPPPDAVDFGIEVVGSTVASQQ